MRFSKYDESYKIKVKERNNSKSSLISQKRNNLTVYHHEEKSLKKTQIFEKNHKLNLFDNDFDIGIEFQKYYPEGNIGSVLKTMKNEIKKIPNRNFKGYRK